MANNNNLNWHNTSNPLIQNFSGVRGDFYNKLIGSDYDGEDGSIHDVTGAQMLEVIQKGLYKTLVGRRDDAKAVWEEEDDDASYGEYKALKDTVELLDTFLREAPKARYTGLNRPRDYGRYDSYGGPY